MPEAPEKPAGRRTPRRQFAHAKQAGGLRAAGLARVKAFQRLFSGHGVGSSGDQRDADIVLTDLSAFVGLHRRPVFGDIQGEAAEAFLLRSALMNARVEVVQHIFDTLGLSDDVVLALEKAARAEAQG